MRLSIGTAQFGRDYGVANHNGKIGQDEIKDIFKIAIENSIDTFDTAEDYGNSEEIIGKMTKALNMDAKVITKIFIDPKDSELICLKKSLKLLNTESVYGLLSHDPRTLIGDKSSKIFSMLVSAKERGLAEKIGVSVATPNQAREILDRYDLDIIQVSCNLFDQRFLPIIKDFVEAGIEVHIRSIFLQGLFFVNNLGSYFDDLRQSLVEVRSAADKNFTSIRGMALGFAKTIPSIDRIIVGMDNASQLKEIIDDYNADIDNYNFDKFSVSDDRFINPSRWPVGGWH